MVRTLKSCLAEAGIAASSLVLIAVGCTGCTGFALPDAPGGDGLSASLSTGGIAVDPRTENAFLLERTAAGADSVTSTSAAGGPIYVINPDTGGVSTIAELSGFGEIRLTFPDSSVLVFAEDPTSGSDTLMRFDMSSLQMQGQLQTSAQYWGTRTSPSGSYVAVANSAVSPTPIDVIEASSLTVHELAPTGSELEAMWLRSTDTLVTIFFSEGADTLGSARIVTWQMQTLESNGYSMGSDGVWAGATLDVTVPNVGFDLDFSYTWVGVSPDDRTVVFPVIAQDSSTDASGHELLVLDVSSGSLRTVNNAYGPVGFTPDGSTIVSYTNGTTGNDAQLLLVDASTLEVQMADIPGVSAPSYYVTSGGDDVVIASNIGLTQLLVYDVSTHSYEKVGGPVVGLSNFVERASHDELWMLDDGLFRLELSTGALTQIPISWTPEDIDILPMHDLLVMDDSASGNIRYFDPSSETVTRTVLLPLAPAPDAGP